METKRGSLTADAVWVQKTAQNLPMITLLALCTCMVIVFFIKNMRPLTDTLQYRYYRFSFFCKAVFNTRRNLIILLSLNYIIAEQFFECRCQHCIGYICHLAAQFAVTKHLL